MRDFVRRRTHTQCDPRTSASHELSSCRRSRLVRLDNAQPFQGESRVPAGPTLQDLTVDHEAAGFAGQRTPGCISRSLSASGPTEADPILVDVQVVDRDMEAGKGGTVERDAKFDACGALDEIGD